MACIRATPQGLVARPRMVAARAGAGAAAREAPNMEKRTTVNALLLGAVGLPVGLMAVPFLAYFVPPRCA